MGAGIVKQVSEWFITDIAVEMREVRRVREEGSEIIHGMNLTVERQMAFALGLWSRTFEPIVEYYISPSG